MLSLLLILLAALLATLVVGASAAVGARRQRRRYARILTERLTAEGRIEQLTAQTLQAMHQAAREYLRSNR